MPTADRHSIVLGVKLTPAQYAHLRALSSMSRVPTATLARLAIEALLSGKDLTVTSSGA